MAAAGMVSALPQRPDHARTAFSGPQLPKIDLKRDQSGISAMLIMLQIVLGRAPPRLATNIDDA